MYKLGAVLWTRNVEVCWNKLRWWRHWVCCDSNTRTPVLPSSRPQCVLDSSNSRGQTCQSELPRRQVLSYQVRVLINGLSFKERSCWSDVMWHALGPRLLTSQCVNQANERPQASGTLYKATSIVWFRHQRQLVEMCDTIQPNMPLSGAEQVSSTVFVCFVNLWDKGYEIWVAYYFLPNVSALFLFLWNLNIKQ